MSTHDDLFWVILENDINNKDIYFPPGTPLTALHTKRHYNLLRKEHYRQKERLITQQLQEIERFEEKFIIEHRDKFVYRNASLLEEMTGQECLRENGTAINQLLSAGSTKELSDIDVSEKPPDKFSLEQLSRLRKKYKQGLGELVHQHQKQYERMMDYHRKDISSFPADVIRSKASSRLPESDQTKSAQKHSRNKLSGKAEEPLKRRKVGTEQKAVETPSFSKSRATVSLHMKNRIPPVVASQAQHDRGPPIVASSSQTATQPTSISSSGPPKVASSQTHLKGKTPPAEISSAPLLSKRPPMVTSSSNSKGPPTVSTSSKESTPLFNKGSKNKSKTFSLIDKGTLRIVKSPNRVIICDQNGVQTVYGDPKDYDDAINGSNTRPDNPVYKRMMNGVFHLFYKTESGRVVTIGPVSKIQPAIHSFFLSM